MPAMPSLAELPTIRTADATLRDKPFLYFYDHTLTYGELEARANQAAHALLRAGVRPAQVVSALLTSSPELVIHLFGVWKAGATFSPLNPHLTAEEVAYQLDHARPAVLLTEVALEGLALEATRVAQSSPSVALVDGRDPGSYAAIRAECPVTPPLVPTDPTAPALLFYTSGTTGRPKGVLLAGRSVVVNAQQVAERTEVTRNDRVLHAMPMFHTNGIVNNTVLPLLIGASVVPRRRFVAEEFWPAVARYRPTYCTGVPTMYRRLLEVPSDGLDVSSLRFGRCGSGPLPVALQETVERRLGLPLVVSYGLTEATCSSTMNPVRGPRVVGSVGPPLRGQEISIMGPDGEAVPAGQIGEVCVRGETVMLGYLRDEGATARQFRGGWLRTGDLGYLGRDGYLFLTGRSKDVIIRGGENIAIGEVEDVLARHPRVLEVGVAGVPDLDWGEEVGACLVLTPGPPLENDSLEAFCRARLARYKVPSRFRLVDALPRNALGKVSRPALQRMLTDGTRDEPTLVTG